MREGIPIGDQVRDLAKRLIRGGRVVYTNDVSEERRLRKTGVTPLPDAIADLLRLTPMRVRQLLFSANFGVVDAYRWTKREGIHFHRCPVLYVPTPVVRHKSRRRVMRRVTRTAFGNQSF